MFFFFRLNSGALACSRSYGTSEANSSPPKETPAPTELEKKLAAENETLSVEITSLNEKNDELLVGICSNGC